MNASYITVLDGATRPASSELTLNLFYIYFIYSCYRYSYLDRSHCQCFACGIIYPLNIDHCSDME